MFRGLSSQGYPKINWHHNLKVWSCLISVTHTVNFYVLLFSIYALFFYFIISRIKKQHKLYLQTNPRLQIYQTNFITYDGHCDEAQGFLQIMNTDQKTVWNMGKSSSSDCILCLSISRSFLSFHLMFCIK